PVTAFVAESGEAMLQCPDRNDGENSDRQKDRGREFTGPPRGEGPDGPVENDGQHGPLLGDVPDACPGIPPQQPGYPRVAFVPRPPVGADLGSRHGAVLDRARPVPRPTPSFATPAPVSPRVPGSPGRPGGRSGPSALSTPASPWSPPARVCLSACRW